MNYLLDTNICIFFFRNEFDITDRILSAEKDNCYISEITLVELLYGAKYSAYPQKNLKLIEELLKEVEIVPISKAIEEFTSQNARLKKQGNLIPDFDLFIGATAIVHDLTLVTDNLKDFNRLQNIKIENWVAR